MGPASSVVGCWHQRQGWMRWGSTGQSKRICDNWSENDDRLIPALPLFRHRYAKFCSPWKGEQKCGLRVIGKMTNHARSGLCVCVMRFHQENFFIPIRYTRDKQITSCYNSIVNTVQFHRHTTTTLIKDIKPVLTKCPKDFSAPEPISWKSKEASVFSLFFRGSSPTSSAESARRRDFLQRPRWPRVWATWSVRRHTKSLWRSWFGRRCPVNFSWTDGIVAIFIPKN